MLERKIEPLSSTAKIKLSISAMTCNLGCLPMITSHYFRVFRVFPPLVKQINSGLLQGNLLRAELFVAQVKKMHEAKEDTSPDIIAFQEVFCSKVSTFISAQLESLYPHQVGDLSKKSWNIGSGNMVLSKFPFNKNAVTFSGFSNYKIGPEQYADKGLTLLNEVEIIPNKYHISVANLHLISGDTFPCTDRISIRQGGTTAERLDAQMLQVAEKLSDISPLSKDNKSTRIQSLVLGDFNTRLNSKEMMLAETQSDEVAKGQKKLFGLFEPTVPQNFYNIWDYRADSELILNEFKFNFAKRHGLFTGSYYDGVINEFLTPQHGFDLLDGIFINRSDKKKFPCQFQSSIVSLGIASDHRAVLGRCEIDVDLTAEEIKNLNPRLKKMTEP